MRDARWYIPRAPLGDKEKASQGAAFFVAPNPPFGAVFTYYLRDEVRTRQKQRREREKEIEKEGRDTPYPGWEELRREELEEDPAIVLTVRDDAGEVVRRVTGPVTAGFHRVAWDLRYPSPEPWSPEDEEEDWEEWTRGLLAGPGRYTVSLAHRIDGVLTDLGQTQSFQVVPQGKGTLPGASPEQLVAWTRELDSMRRDVGAAASALDETSKRLAGIREALMESTGAAGLHDEARALERRLSEMQERLGGNRTRSRAGDPGPVSVSRRLEVAVDGSLFSTYGPTRTHRESLDIAHREFAALRGELDRMIREELPALERRLDAAGVPWTPGRGVAGGSSGKR